MVSYVVGNFRTRDLLEWYLIDWDLLVWDLKVRDLLSCNPKTTTCLRKKSLLFNLHGSLVLKDLIENVS